MNDERYLSAHELFEAQARHAPEAIALRCGIEEITYRDLAVLARRVAGALRASGVGREDTVLVCVAHPVELVASILGVLMAGAAYLPCDAATPRAHLSRAADAASPSAALVDVASARGLVGRTLETRDALAHDPADPVIVDPESAAYVILTSGSTGTPKPVVVPHRALTRLALGLAARFGVTAADRVLQLTSPSWDTFGEEVYPALVRGATIILRESGVVDLTDLLGVCHAQGVTVIDLPTALWHEIVALGTVRDLPASLRLVVIGGEAAHPARVREWHATAGARPVLLNTYGATEAGAVSIAATLDDATIDGAVPIGLPLAHVRAYVLDEALTPCVEGELFIGGDALARGYAGDVAKTAERFVPDPFAGALGARMHRTGDLARVRADGAIELLGRRDRQVKIRGSRVELGDVEAHVSALAGVGEAAVVVRDGALEAFVAWSTPRTIADVRRELEGRLPHYMIPTRWQTIARLPRAISGKIDRQALMHRLAEVPVAAPLAIVGGPILTTLARIWVELLGVATVAHDDHFFELGGHSVVALRVVLRIRQELGIQVPIRLLFEHPILGELARALEGASRDTGPRAAIVPMARETRRIRRTRSGEG